MPTAKEAIQELLEMSASIRHAVLVRGESEMLASTFANSQSEADHGGDGPQDAGGSPHVGQGDGSAGR